MRPYYWKNPKPETVKKWIDTNKELYSKEIKELDFIIRVVKKMSSFFQCITLLLVAGRLLIRC